MVAISRKMCMLEVIDDNEEDFLVQIATRSRNAAFLQILLRYGIDGCQKIYYSSFNRHLFPAEINLC